MMGMHGEAWVNQAIQQADLLIALGMRFDDRVTGNLKTYAPNAKKIHIEIDPSEVGKNVNVDAALLGDLRDGLVALTPKVAPKQHGDWLAQVDTWRQDTRTRDILHQPDHGKLLAAHVMADIWKATGGDAIVVTDVGQHQMWEAQYYKHDKPRTLITSGGLGTMGFALPAAIGAKIARPDAEVWVIVGDGGFQMTTAELATLVQESVKINIAIINNGYLGMVRQWQEFFYEERYSEVYLSPDLPDYVKWAEAMGCVAIRVDTPDDVVPDDREGQRGRRPSGGDRLPHRLPREGVPDGPGRPVERQHHPRPRVRRRRSVIMTSRPHHILTVTVENKPGVLSRVAGLFARRACNIVSLAVSPTDDERFSRMTIVVDADSAPLEQIVKQLNKLPNAIKVQDFHEGEYVDRELVLVKVAVDSKSRAEVMQITDIFRAKIVDVQPKTLTIEITGNESKVEKFLDLMKTFGVMEITRTGKAAMPRK